MDYSLSGIDIDRILTEHDQPHIVATYHDIARELANGKSIRQLLDNKVLVICFETRPQYGHWICVFENSEGMQFFDSYGIEVDGEQRWNFDPDFKRRALEDYPWLLRAMYISGCPVIYNEYTFQAHDSRVRTCGRWVCLRAIFACFSCDEFASMVASECVENQQDPDELVCALIY